MNLCPICKLVHEPTSPCTVSLQSVITMLLKNVGEPGHCKGCREPIFWVVHRNGKKTPYDPAGLNHFVSCAQAAQFR